MRRAILIAGMAKSIPTMAGDYFGIDKGAFIAMRQDVPLKCAIGDFDSISKAEKEVLELYCPLVSLPTHKNETDSEAAIQHVLSLGYDSIILYGGLGGRIDHELANIRLMTQRRYPMVIMDENNYMEVLTPNVYHIFKKKKYLSFLALEPTCISETGVAYPLYKQNIDVEDIYTISNEIDQEATVIVHSGRVLMIQSSDKTR